MRSLRQDFGIELRRRRMAAGMSLRDLAAEIHYTRGYIGKVENGQHASIEFARLCDTALNAGGELAACAQPYAGDALLAAGDLMATWGIELGLNQQSWFSVRDGPWGATPGSGLAIPDPAGHASATVPELTLFARWFDDFRALGQRTSPGLVLPMLIAQTHALRRLAGEAGPAGRAPCFLLAARYAEYTGWMIQEGGDDNAAIWWTDLAAKLADAGGDRAMSAYALVRRALVTLYRDDAAGTIDLAVRAQESQYGTARIRGLAALREAQGRAMVGEYDECRRALDNANEHLSAAPRRSSAPVIGTSTVPDPVAMTMGWCLYELGRPGEAAAVLEAELVRLPRSAQRTRARYGIRCALAAAAAGEVDRACAGARQVLPEVHAVASATISTDLRRLGRTLNRWHSHGQVRELLPELHGLRREADGFRPAGDDQM